MSPARAVETTRNPNTSVSGRTVFLISIEILQRSGTNTVRSAAVSARKKVDQLTEIRLFSIGVLSVP